MDYPGSRQWKTGSDFLELFPADAALVAAAAEPEPPGLLGVLKYNLKACSCHALRSTGSSPATSYIASDVAP